LEMMEILIEPGKLLDSILEFSAKESLRYYEMKQHNLRLDAGCQKLSDQREKSQTVTITESKQILII
jgi:hypothetical protein